MEAVTLNSGGIDSLAVISKLAGKGHDLHSLFLDLGHPSTDRMRKSAERIAARYCVAHQEFEMDGYYRYEFLDGKNIAIPFQAALCTMIASVTARHKHIDYVVTAIKRDLQDGSFDDRFMNMLKYSKMTPPVVVVSPFKDIDGFDAIYKLVKDNPLLPLTVSCNMDPECGVCPKCELRNEYDIATT